MLTDPGPTEGLPPFLASVVAAEPDERPMPALGLGDQDASVALLAATRAVLLARTAIEIVAAVGRFSVEMGGRLVPATEADESAIPLDITLGVAAPVLVDADRLSIARMRLEQFLPALVEDARSALSQLRRLEDVPASSPEPVPGSPMHDEGLS